MTAFLNRCLLMFICSWRKVDLLDQSMLGVRRREVRGKETSQTLGGSNCKQPRSRQIKLFEGQTVNSRRGNKTSQTPGQRLGRETEKHGFSSFSLWGQKLTWVLLYDPYPWERSGKSETEHDLMCVWIWKPYLLFVCSTVTMWYIYFSFNIDFRPWPSDNYELWRSRI